MTKAPLDLWVASKVVDSEETQLTLRADYVPPAIVRGPERMWNCPVFNHYGTTEKELTRE